MTTPLWHLTNKKNFKPSVDARPITAGGWDVAKEPMLYATRDPNYWFSVSGGGRGPWAAKRKWAVELALLPGHPPVARENPLRPETVLDPKLVRVVRIIPIEAAIAETTGWYGDHFVGNDYRYHSGDEQKYMTEASHQAPVGVLVAESGRMVNGQEVSLTPKEVLHHFATQVNYLKILTRSYAERGNVSPSAVDDWVKHFLRTTETSRETMYTYMREGDLPRDELKKLPLWRVTDFAEMGDDDQWAFVQGVTWQTILDAIDTTVTRALDLSKRLADNSEVRGPMGTRVINVDPVAVKLKEMEWFAERLDLVRTLLKRAGVDSVLRGRRFFVGAYGNIPCYPPAKDPLLKSTSGGYYRGGPRPCLHVDTTTPDVQIREGDILIDLRPWALGGDGILLVTTLVHELGHAYFFERVSDGQRARWTEYFGLAHGHVSSYAETSAVEDFAEVFAFVVAKRRGQGIWSKPDKIQDAVERLRAFIRSGSMPGFSEPKENTMSPQVPVGVLVSEGAVPQWVKAAEARGETFVGPNGNEAIGYEWKWKWGFKEDKREGGLVDARVSDWDSADQCVTCGRNIVHIYWIKDKTTGNVEPYGVEHLHVALGYPRAVGKKEQTDILKKIDARGLADKRVAGQIARLTKKLADLRHKHEETTAKLAVWDRSVAIVAKMKEPPIEFEIKKSVTGGEDIPIARMGDETVWLTFTHGKLDKERETTLRRQWRDSTAADVYSRESGGNTYGDIRMRLDRQGVKTMAADIEKASKALHSLMPGKVTTDVAPAADESVRQVPVGVLMSEASPGDDYVLAPPGETGRVGPERGKLVSDGVAKFVSPHGSYRYVLYEHGVPMSGIQIMSRDGRAASIAYVYTVPERRRQGLAVKLLARARRDFKTIEHAEHLTDMGQAWKAGIGERVAALAERAGPDGWVDMLDERSKPPKAECRVCKKHITVNKDGTLGSHLRDVEGRRIHCPARKERRKKRQKAVAEAAPAKPKPPAGAKRAMKLVKITQKGAEKEAGEDERHRASQTKIRQATDDAKRKALLTTEARERMLAEAAMKPSGWIHQRASASRRTR